MRRYLDRARGSRIHCLPCPLLERRTEREEILARRPRPMQVKLQRARAPERLAATYSSPCTRQIMSLIMKRLLIVFCS